MRACLLIAILAVGCARPGPTSPPTKGESPGPPLAAAAVTKADAKGERTLPVAPMPRKVVQCNCIYCSCAHKPHEDFPQFNKCRCSEQRCKDNGCDCGKWEKSKDGDDDK